MTRKRCLPYELNDGKLFAKLRYVFAKYLKINNLGILSFSSKIQSNSNAHTWPATIQTARMEPTTCQNSGGTRQNWRAHTYDNNRGAVPARTSRSCGSAITDFWWKKICCWHLWAYSMQNLHMTAAMRLQAPVLEWELWWVLADTKHEWFYLPEMFKWDIPWREWAMRKFDISFWQTIHRNFIAIFFIYEGILYFTKTV